MQTFIKIEAMLGVLAIIALSQCIFMTLYIYHLVLAGEFEYGMFYVPFCVTYRTYTFETH